MQRISLRPDPPVQGGDVEICYDFDGSGQSQVTIMVTFFPGSETSEHTLTPSEPCVIVAVPDNAQSITVEDRSGTSPEKRAPVDPA